MKLIRTIVRNEKEENVLARLEEAGLFAVTKFPVLGRGRQRGIQVGAISYTALSKVMLLIVVEDSEYQKAVDAIEAGAHTGHPGDGKIFVQNVSESYTIRTGGKAIT